MSNDTVTALESKAIKDLHASPNKVRFYAEVVDLITQYSTNPDKKPFSCLWLTDASKALLPCMYFNPQWVPQDISAGDIIKVSGRVSEFRDNRIQIIHPWVQKVGQVEQNEEWKLRHQSQLAAINKLFRPVRKSEPFEDEGIEGEDSSKADKNIRKEH